MHREKQILLGFLGLLCGGFVAVLGAKLFIPRPPAGAGPDIDAPPALVTPQLVVEPPALSTVADRQAVPRSTPDVEDPPPPAPVANDRYASASGFTRRDDLVAPAAFLDEPADLPAVDEIPTADAAASHTPDESGPPVEPVRGAASAEERVPIAAPIPPAANPLRSQPPPVVDRPPPLPAAPAVTSSAPLRDQHITVAGDSWWSIAERAYGEGRYFRALYAWNRTVNPHVSLLPGTRLEIPTVSRLEAAWPKLVPPTTAVGSPRRTD